LAFEGDWNSKKETTFWNIEQDGGALDFTSDI